MRNVRTLNTSGLRAELLEAFDAFAYGDEFQSSFRYGGRWVTIEKNVLRVLGTSISFDLAKVPGTNRKAYNSLKMDEMTLPAVLDNNEKIINLLNLD